LRRPRPCSRGPQVKQPPGDHTPPPPDPGGRQLLAFARRDAFPAFDIDFGGVSCLADVGREGDDIDARLDALPKAIAQAFGEAFDNARMGISREIREASDAHHRELLAELHGNHRELVGKLTEMFGAVPTRAEVPTTPASPS
jgi:hypothetical protein